MTLSVTIYDCRQGNELFVGDIAVILTPSPWNGRVLLGEEARITSIHPNYHDERTFVGFVLLNPTDKNNPNFERMASWPDEIRLKDDGT